MAWEKHEKFDTPVNAILMIAVITSLAPLLGKNMLSWLSNAGSFATVITYLIVSVSFLVLRKNGRRWNALTAFEIGNLLGRALYCCAC